MYCVPFNKNNFFGLSIYINNIKIKTVLCTGRIILDTIVVFLDEKSTFKCTKRGVSPT